MMKLTHISQTIGYLNKFSDTKDTHFIAFDLFEIATWDNWFGTQRYTDLSGGEKRNITF